MATTTLRPSGAKTDVTGTWTRTGGSTDADAIDEDVDTPTDTDYLSTGAGTSGVADVVRIGLTDTPSDFGYATAFTLKWRGQFSGWSDDSLSTNFQLKKSDLTPVIYRGSGTSWNQSTAFTESGTESYWAGIPSWATMNKADWDAAIAEFSMSRSTAMSADAISKRVIAFEIDITYIEKTPLTLAAYRFDSDGTETGSSQIAAQSTGISMTDGSGDLNALLRMRIQNGSIAGQSTDDFQLQYDVNGSGNWTPVGGGFGTEAVTDSATTSNAAINIGASMTYQGAAQSFVGNGRRLSKIKVRLNRTNGPTGNIVVKLRANTSGQPGTVLATANIPTGSVGTADTTVTAVFNNDVLMVNGTTYWVYVEYTGGNPTNYISVRYNTTTTHSGEFYLWQTSSWLVNNPSDMWFEVDSVPDVVVVAPFNSSNLTDGSATTNRLTGGTGSFFAGKISEDGEVDDLTMTANNFTELLFPITLKDAQLVGADVVTFRVVKNRNLLPDADWTYSVTPTVTVTSGPSVFKTKQSGSFVTPAMMVKSGGVMTAAPVKTKQSGVFV